MTQLGRFARTATQLGPAQVAHRIRLRTQSALLASSGRVLAPHVSRSVPATWGWPAGFVPIDARLAHEQPAPLDTSDGAFCFLGESRQLGVPPDWKQLEAAQLWRYNLHYLEWAWPFTASEDRMWARAAFARLWASWKSGTVFGRWDEWSPYVVALRTWVLCGIHETLVAGSGDELAFAGDVALHAGFVAANLERDVGGNHLVKDLKAMVGAGLFLRDGQLVERGCELLARQLQVQILADGGHYERSPSYHCQVLGDLLDMERLLVAAGGPPVAGLLDTIEAMRRWLGVILLPNGEVPLLNDSTPVGPDRLAALAPEIPVSEPLTVLPQTGYFVARVGGWHVIGDVGAPCPPELPAHAHADTLSFTLSLDGEPVLVDTGTSEYGSGPRRRYERSTAAHNTLEVDGVDSTEVWGAFRAGRRARPTMERAEASEGEVTVVASHDGYRQLRGRPIHRRTWRLTPDALEVTDELAGRGSHRAVTRFHILGTRRTGDHELILGAVQAEVAEGTWELVPAGQGDAGLVATNFGCTVPAACLEVRSVGRLPLRMAVRLRPYRNSGATSPYPSRADVARGAL